MLYNNYFVTDGIQNMDFDKIQEMLSTSFWVTGISKEEIIKGSENSAIVVGAFFNKKIQVGFARAISDKTRFAYILDVFIHKDHRKKGIGQAMINHILHHNELKDVYQWLLITEDAHGVYEKSGFKIIINPEKWMEIRNNRPSNR